MRPSVNSVNSVNNNDRPTDRAVIDRPSSSSPSPTRKKPTNRFGVRAEKIPTLFKNYIFSISIHFFSRLVFSSSYSLSRLQPHSLTYSASRFPSRTLIEVLLGPMRPSVARAGGFTFPPRGDETRRMKRKKKNHIWKKEV